MNPSLWKKALRVIPDVTLEEWKVLDPLARWLVASRAAVLVMTLLSALIAGLLVLHDGHAVTWWSWVLVCLGLVLAHATNNMLNDYTDFVRGVDKDNYFRTQYGPQPLADGFLSKRQLLTWAGVTGLAGLLCGAALALLNGNDPVIWGFLGAGVVFVVFYTWPLKYIALGELSVLIVWGPLMIGGGYYVMAGHWETMSVWASLPYVLGVTTVIFGKHIDKIEADRTKRIHTLPVLIGERAGRYAMIGLMALSYILVALLVAGRYFTPVLALVVLALPSFFAVAGRLSQPRPLDRPEGFPEGQGGWPLYFAPLAFQNNRVFGVWFLLALVLDTVLRVLPATAGFWRP